MKRLMPAAVAAAALTAHTMAADCAKDDNDFGRSWTTPDLRRWPPSTLSISAARRYAPTMPDDGEQPPDQSSTGADRPPTLPGAATEICARVPFQDLPNANPG